MYEFIPRDIDFDDDDDDEGDDEGDGDVLESLAGDYTPGELRALETIFSDGEDEDEYVDEDEDEFEDLDDY